MSEVNCEHLRNQINAKRDTFVRLLVIPGGKHTRKQNSELIPKLNRENAEDFNVDSPGER